MATAEAAHLTTHPAHLRADCPACGQRDLLHSVSFDALPVLCNSLHGDVKTAKAAETGRFVLAFCRSCTHVFNAAFDEDRIGYTQSYENSLHFSPRFVTFVEALAQRLGETYQLRGKLAVDIGCGKGDFLKRLCAASGARGMGFDKSFETNRGEDVAGVEFVNDWFGDAYPDIRPDFVSCRHVIEHIADPVAFLRELRAHPGVGPDTVFYMEAPNALYTLRDMGIWDLIYEHVSYFTPSSLRAAMEAAGFEVLDQGTSFGEQYLFVEARRDSKGGTDGHAGAKPDAAEIERLVEQFDRSYRNKVDFWRDLLAERDPAQCVVWGAGSKGITFVNVVPEGARIGALADVNPHKQGRFAPRTGTPVVAPEALRNQPPQSIIVMNSLYRGEIADAAAELGLKSDIIVA